MTIYLGAPQVVLVQAVSGGMGDKLGLTHVDQRPGGKWDVVGKSPVGKWRWISLELDSLAPVS